MADALRFGEKFDVFLDKSSIFTLDEDNIGFKCTQAAIVPKGRMFESGVSGHRFVFGDASTVQFFNEPKLVKFTASDQLTRLRRELRDEFDCFI